MTNYYWCRQTAASTVIANKSRLVGTTEAISYLPNLSLAKAAFAPN